MNDFQKPATVELAKNICRCIHADSTYHDVEYLPDRIRAAIACLRHLPQSLRNFGDIKSILQGFKVDFSAERTLTELLIEALSHAEKHGDEIWENIDFEIEYGFF